MPNFNTYATLFEIGFANSQHILLGIAFPLGVYGLLIDGLVATWLDDGRQGLANLWQQHLWPGDHGQWLCIWLLA